MGSPLFESNLQENSMLNEITLFKTRYWRKWLKIKNLIVCLIIAGLNILTGIIEMTTDNEIINIEWLLQILHVFDCLHGKQLFHICLKDDNIVCDFRYFTSRKNNTLQASINGVQMSQEKFVKCTAIVICKK